MRSDSSSATAAQLARIVAFALLAGVLAVTSACGGNDGGEGVGTEPPPTAPEETVPEEEAAPATEFTSREFKPRVTIEVPAGWEPVEEPGVVQFFSGETSQRVLTISSRSAGKTVADAVAQMRATENLDATEPTDATVAGSGGQVFGASVGSGFSTNIPGVDYPVFDGFQIQVWTVDVKGTTVVLIADAPVAEAESFVAETEEILGTIRFGPA